ncbi:MAG: hypothetical protein PHH59_13510 [Methylovulum sp.]|nr:hypothetical protein [Methylovulum sp.]
MKELGMKTAIHEAGHAAAIYFGNKQKQLPPVCFQIAITGLCQNTASGIVWLAKVDGGRLIHTLPSSVPEATREFSAVQKQAYINAFEADIINLLVGPLAEANYIALRDDEIFNSRLVNISSLHHYGGATDLQLVNDYLDCFNFDPMAREQKIAELFAVAFTFIHDRDNWRAIIGLANFILANSQQVIECEEIIAVLDAHSGARRKAA